MKALYTKLSRHITSFRLILISFFMVILAGALLLMLPASSASGTATPFIDALFTSASATCVTGLIVYDTATYWSAFGKTIIFFLIQIGGLGVITVAIAAVMVSGRKIGIRQRSVMMDAISAPQIGGIIRFTRFILLGTLAVEVTGAVLLSIPFIMRFGFPTGCIYAIFHSVSAFCNAGFDLMGIVEPFSSLTSFAGSIWVNLIICLLIIIGGIGFLTWNDILVNRYHYTRYRLQTKIILATTLFLIVVPAVYFFIFEFTDAPLKERILLSVFQSVTPRTAGFNTADYSAMSENSLLISILLMLTGGAPGSTAGGIKVTTFGVIVASTVACLRQQENTSCFKRRIDPSVLHTAFGIMMIYAGLFFIGSLILSGIESAPMINCMFECASALGTVGLTTGITPSLSCISKIMLVLFMYFGRTGGLTLAYAAVSIRTKTSSRYPVEKIMVG
jgi:trk system potassium uptake protein TrkH